MSQNFDLRAARAALDFAVQFTPQYGDSFVEVARLQLLEALDKALFQDITCCQRRQSFSADVPTISKEQLERALNPVATARLELRCANADPNYGAVWFECRHRPTDTARIVLARARSRLLADVHTHQRVYAAALARHRRLTSTGIKLEAYSHAVSSYTNADFVTGLIGLDRLVLNKCNNERRFQILFGSDFVVP